MLQTDDDAVCVVMVAETMQPAYPQPPPGSGEPRDRGEWVIIAMSRRVARATRIHTIVSRVRASANAIFNRADSAPGVASWEAT